MKKSKAFPNDTFESQEALFSFMDRVKVYGDMEKLYRLKKAEDKKSHLLEPKLTLPKKT